MAYIGKTWVNNEIVEAVDMNRIEQGISDADVGLGNMQAEVTAHLNEDTQHIYVDKNSPTTSYKLVVVDGRPYLEVVSV